MPEATVTAPATGAVADATSAQTTAVSPSADATTTTATTPATGDADGLGDAGKRAIERMKAERDDAKRIAGEAVKRAEDLENATKSDTEKAIAQAKRDGAAEVLTRVHGQIRRAEVRAALTAAGANPNLIDLAVKADEFGGLKVDDEGEIDGLAAAVEAFKKAHPDLFAKPGTAGTADGGARGGKSGLTREIIEKMTPAEHAARRDEIFEFLQQR